MVKMNDVEGGKPDTKIAPDAAVLRTRMPSTTQIEGLDIFYRFIRQQLQTNWNVPVVLSRPSRLHASPTQPGVFCSVLRGLFTSRIFI